MTELGSREGAVDALLARRRPLNKLLTARSRCATLGAFVNINHSCQQKPTPESWLTASCARRIGTLRTSRQVSTEEAAADGRADYLLKNSRTRPLGIVETKRFSIDPYSAKDADQGIRRQPRRSFHHSEQWARALLLGLRKRRRPANHRLSHASRPRKPRQSPSAPARAIWQHPSAQCPMPTHFRFKGEDVEARPYQIRCLAKRR